MGDRDLTESGRSCQLQNSSVGPGHRLRMPSRALADFRSDTTQRLSPRARRAIIKALDVPEGHPPVDDSWVLSAPLEELQKRISELLGMPQVLYFPTGVSANQSTMAALGGPGATVLAGTNSHLALLEGQGLDLAGLSVVELGGDGTFTTDQLTRELAVLEGSGNSHPIVAIENTHVMSGGRVWDWEQLRGVVDTAGAHGASVYLDGARLFDAASASGVTPAEMLSGVNAAMVSLSKGLGAPDGALVAFRAPELRTRLELERLRRGGPGHQTPAINAAAALVGLEENLDRIPISHELARRLYEELSQLSGIEMWPDGFGGSNIVLFRPDRGRYGAPQQLLEYMDQNGVLASGRNWIRLVTHPTTTLGDSERALEVIQAGLAQLTPI